jgi:GTP pyrophosphokinase
MWKPIPGRFKDYIAMPKPNRYQSLHTTVIGDNGEPFEIQSVLMRCTGLRIWYRCPLEIQGGVRKTRRGQAGLAETNLGWQKALNDPKEFMETLKVDLFSNQFLFLPQRGRDRASARLYSAGFAFKIHSAIGQVHRAKVNGKMVPIDHTLKNGNIVEIITSSNSRDRASTG